MVAREAACALRINNVEFSGSLSLNYLCKFEALVECSVWHLEIITEHD